MPAELDRPSLDVGLVTADLAGALFFWRDLMGFDPVTVLARDTGDIHVLAAGEVFVKLVDVPSAPRGPGGAITDATGVRYLTFWVRNLSALVEQCREAGVTVVREAREVTPGTTAVLLADPDGNVVELLSTEGPSEPRPACPD